MPKKNLIAQYISEDDLKSIENVLTDVELKTSGELRLCLKKKRGYLETGLTPRELAVNEFYKLGMDNTAGGTGVLFFIIFDEHKFEIVADKGINEKIPEERWKELSEGIIRDFSQNKFKDGIIFMIKSVGEVLVKEFPVKEGDVNELPDDILIG